MKDGKANILVVDDDERTLRMMEAMLRPQGYGVITARDGKEAVEITRKKKPDIVLMDLMMPRMDGFSACREIKTNPATQKIPVIMLTAASGRYNEQLAKEVWSADGYLNKPVDIAELKGTINLFLS